VPRWLVVPRQGEKAMDLGLKGKTALVTGASEGIGRATARAQGTSSDVILGQLINTIPSGRVGTGEDIADAVCCLVSERASYVNGAALVVDGSKSLVI